MHSFYAVTQMITSKQKDIALFPLPGMIPFPYASVPLHIFEPRYRQMVQFCLETETDMAVVYAKRVAKELKDFDPNNLTRSIWNTMTSAGEFEHHTVFSAGKFDLVESLPDGRYVIQLNPISRYRFISNRQSNPFIIARCEEIVDQKEVRISELDELYREKIEKVNQYLEISSQSDPDKRSYYLTRIKKEDSFNKYTFSVLSMLGVDDRKLLDSLESDSVFDRFKIIDSVLGG